MIALVIIMSVVALVAFLTSGHILKSDGRSDHIAPQSKPALKYDPLAIDEGGWVPIRPTPAILDEAEMTVEVATPTADEQERARILAEKVRAKLKSARRP